MASIGKIVRQDERITAREPRNNVVSIRLGDAVVPLRAVPGRTRASREKDRSSSRHSAIEAAFLMAAVGAAVLIWLSGN